MLTKLQPDQVGLLWDVIRDAILKVYKIPKKLQQDFTNKHLERMLSGLTQCWLGYEINEEGNKKIHFIVITEILDDSIHGLRVLVVDTLLGFRFISDKMVEEGLAGLEEYAKANKCGVMAAESPGGRPAEFLLKNGFEEHKVIYRKFIN